MKGEFSMNKPTVKASFGSPMLVKTEPVPDSKTERQDNCGDYRLREVQQDYTHDKRREA